METTTKTQTQPAGGKPERGRALRTKPGRYRLKKSGVARENHSVVLKFGLDSIRILFDAGMDATAVAARIGCAKSTLYSALSRHWGLSPKRVSILSPVHTGVLWPDATTFSEGVTLGQVRDILSQNVRMKDMSALLGMSPDTLYNCASNLGFKFAEKTLLVPAAKEAKSERG